MSHHDGMQRKPVDVNENQTAFVTPAYDYETSRLCCFSFTNVGQYSWLRGLQNPCDNACQRSSSEIIDDLALDDTV
eukprot:m.63709 g.63709  ORF g.63709 m.63709 type:complete len:76 (+) comp11959_c0_seq9:2302-2529(+)